MFKNSFSPNPSFASFNGVETFQSELDILRLRIFHVPSRPIHSPLRRVSSFLLFPFVVVVCSSFRLRCALPRLPNARKLSFVKVAFKSSQPSFLCRSPVFLFRLFETRGVRDVPENMMEDAVLRLNRCCCCCRRRYYPCTQARQCSSDTYEERR